MTSTEIQLFNELIRETVKSAMKEERSLIKQEMSKDLKEIKLLLAKVIKENKVIKETLLSESQYSESSPSLSPEVRSGLMEMVGGGSRAPREAPEHLRTPDRRYRIPEWKQPSVAEAQKIEEGVNALAKKVGINTNAKKLQNVLALTAKDMNSGYDDPLQALASSIQPSTTE